MKKYTTGKGKFAASLLIAGVLTMGTVGAAFADSPAQDTSVKQGYFGDITAKDLSSFTVNTRANGEIQLAVVPDTHFRAPGRSETSIGDLALGGRVAILAEGRDDTLTALRVMLVPGQPQREHRVLTVVEASGTTVLAEDEQGHRVEVILEDELSGDLAGQLVTFIGERSQQSNRFKAKAQVKIGRVVQRMEAQSQRLQKELKDGRQDQDRGRQEQDLARLHERLESLMQQHLDRFSGIIDRAPEEAKPHLEQALEMSSKGYRAGLEALEIPQDHIEARIDLRTIQGVVKSVEAGTGRITLQTRGGAVLTLDVTNETRVHMEDQDLNLSDITPGALIVVKYDRESFTATKIRVKTETKAEEAENHRPGGKEETQPTGAVTGIDLDSGKISITTNSGRIITLSLDPDEGSFPLSDPLIGQRVKVGYDSETRVISKIERLNRGRSLDRDYHNRP